MAFVPAPNRFIVTGKFTADGSNSWRRADGTWSRVIAEAELLTDEASGKVHVTRAVATEQREITDPYVIPVFADGASIDPLSARERIRANGPTVRIRRPD
jgi:hypothetical protein